MRPNASQWVRMDPNGSEHVRKPRKTRENFEQPLESFENFRENFFHGAVFLKILENKNEQYYAVKKVFTKIF